MTCHVPRETGGHVMIILSDERKCCHDMSRPQGDMRQGPRTQWCLTPELSRVARRRGGGRPRPS